jgi:D-alanyl-lipoteichoic acid acyltransferase DltB (MBOAT superfamily)
MLFNSGIFLQFFAAFLLLYWLLRNNLRARNILIVIASYLFYGWWDYRFLTLLAFSSVLDYFVGLGISRQADPRRRKLWLACSVVANLTILGFFKYFDFFILSFAAFMKELNIPVSVHTLGIILPVGISFYTFQAMSYTIDVYRGEIPATRSLINFLAYVSFFPQLVAGPIERAHHLLPQFDRTLSITRPMLVEGIWLMLWGMFKKVFIADNLDPLVAMVYGSGSYSAPVVLLATIAFAFQIYCDFSGYSDIARGTARILGFDIMFNFNLPYAAASIREFWRRWHISLSTWLRDYLYISLGGNRAGKARTYANLWITMVLGGLWHGAAWNFVSWGMWHAVGLMVNRAFGARTAGLRPTARMTSFFSWLVTMSFVLYGWLLFRARSLDEIIAMTRALTHFSAPVWIYSYLLNLVVFTLPLVVVELWQIRSRNLLAPLTIRPWLRAALQGVLLVGIILYWERNQTPFIYFQF